MPSLWEFGWLLGSAPCYLYRWRGDYGGKKQLWFPSNYVEEMVSPAALEPEREVRTEPRWRNREGSRPSSRLCTHPSWCQACLCSHSHPARDRHTLWCSWSPVYTCHIYRHMHTCKIYLSRAHRHSLTCTCIGDMLTSLWALLPTALGREQPLGGLTAGGLGCASLSDW